MYLHPINQAAFDQLTDDHKLSAVAAMTGTHADMVSALAKPGLAIIHELSPAKAHLLHMAVGVSGEAGELLDAIKKHVVYGKPLDVANVIEEMGDLLFYMTGLLPEGVTLSDCVDANKIKLSKRYASGSYSNAAAIERADKEPGQ